MADANQSNPFQSNPFVAGFDAMQGMASLWGQSGQAFLTAQQKMFADMAERMKTSGDGSGFGAPGMPANAEAFAKAGRAYSELWSNASKLAGVAAGKDGGDKVVSQLMGRIFDPQLWLSVTGDVDQSLTRMAEGPRLADLFETERKFMAVFNAWLGVRRRTFEHNSLMLQAWTRAVTEFSKALNEKSGRGESFESWRDMETLWIETANTVLLETQRTEAYLQSQRELLNASTELRLAQQEVGEFYSEMFGFPTRTEIDDVHKTVTELRREVRGLKRALAEARRPNQAKVDGGAI